METDVWLERWLPSIGSASLDKTVLELGCDTGRDTAYLAGKGFAVVATDISAEALQTCASAVPSARVMHHDLREPLPFRDRHFGVVVASLCLHYFEWQKTQDIVREIGRCLTPGGLLLCRVNSAKDIHHGAVGYTAVQPGYYLVNDTYSSLKRFFDREAIESLFGPMWNRVALEELTIDRYEKPKVVWEVVLRKAPD
jgi:SAM-dependent methyltransferase